MTVEDFVKEEVARRIKATVTLSKPLEINGIKISAGCDEDGIEICGGIYKLADILGVPVQLTSVKSSNSYIQETTGFTIKGVRFYEVKYRLIKGEKEENDSQTE